FLFLSCLLFLKFLRLIVYRKTSRKIISSFDTTTNLYLRELLFFHFSLALDYCNFLTLLVCSLSPSFSFSLLFLYLPHKIYTMNFNPTRSYLVKSNVVVWFYVFLIFLFNSLVFVISLILGIDCDLMRRI
ncbi:hypothetical protein PanWU01x14_326360, partial [Parasponia andersonii]